MVILSIDQVALAILLSMNISWGNPVSDRELLCTAHAVYHEARGEELHSKLAVASVIKNRVDHKRFPDSFCDVVKQPSAFSYTIWDNRRHIELKNNIDINSWERSVVISLVTMTDSVSDITEGATNYLNKSIVSRVPDWYRAGEPKGQFGSHHFVRLDW
jgi:spore germination cell wall hydrolase CwlJ-like protein